MNDFTLPIVASLVITNVSQASAIQRSGRAGRVRAGKAYRLYTGITNVDITVYCFKISLCQFIVFVKRKRCNEEIE